MSPHFYGYVNIRLVIAIISTVENVVGNRFQQKLIEEVLKTVNPSVRPVWEITTPTNVTLSLAPYQLLDIDEVNQCITMSAWMTETWENELISWNPNDYGGITEIRIGKNEIWRPDTYLYNNLVMDEQNVQRITSLRVTTMVPTRVSKVTLQFPAIYKTSCLFYIEKFPFDVQTCKLKFASWTSGNCEIDYFPVGNNISLKFFSAHQEWDILAFYVERREVTYDCCVCNYTDIEFTLTIQRKPLFYLTHLVIPSVIVTVINFLGFFTPSNSNGDREEKVSLGLTTLLAMGLLLLQLSDHTPKQSKSVPLLALLLISLIFLIGIGTILTMIIMHLQFKCTRKDTCPTYVLRLCETLRFLNFQKPKCRCGSARSSQTTRLKTPHKGVDIPLAASERLSEGDSTDEFVPNFKALRDCRNNTLQLVFDESNYSECCSRALKNYEGWGQLANIFERICLIVFLFVTSLFVSCFFAVGYYGRHKPMSIN